MLVNGSLLDEPVGSATYARAIIGELCEPQVWRPPQWSFIDRPRRAWLARLIYDLTFRLRPAHLRLHPYWATAIDPRCVITALDTIDVDSEPLWQRRLHLAALRSARLVVTLSYSERERLQLLTDKPILVVHPVPDLPFFDKPLVAPAADRTVLGYWGGWHARKDMTALMQTLSGLNHPFELRATNAADVRAPGGLRLTDAGRLDIAGIAEFVDGCTIALYPSTREGFGLPIAEALLRGRPVLARDLPVYREFVTHPERGLVLVDPLDPDSVKRGLAAAQNLAQDPERVKSALAEVTHEQARQRLRRQLRTALPPELVLPG